MARGSSQRGSRNKRKYSGGQTDERKQQILKKLRALKERKENTRHSRQQKNYKVRDIKPLSWYKYLHAYEKENNIIRPHVTLASATNVATNALLEPSNRNSSSSTTTTTTTTTTNNTAVSASNNRLNNFRIGLNAARAAIGDSPPQYNININTQQSL